jgi:hypothetical protein
LLSIIPRDIRNFIATDLNVDNFTNFATTSKETVTDTDLLSMHQQDVQAARVLQSIALEFPRVFKNLFHFGYTEIDIDVMSGLNHIKEVIPELVMELKEFREEIQIGFSQKNLAEIKEKALEFQTILSNETKKNIGDLCDEQRKEPKNFEIFAIYFMKITIINIKSCIIEQENLIAERNQDSNVTFEQSCLDQAHFDKVTSDLNCAGLSVSLYNSFFTVSHLIEDAAVLSLPQPQEMQMYLKERQEKDITLHVDFLTPTLGYDHACRLYEDRVYVSHVRPFQTEGKAHRNESA